LKRSKIFESVEDINFHERRSLTLIP